MLDDGGDGDEGFGGHCRPGDSKPAEKHNGGSQQITARDHL